MWETRDRIDPLETAQNAASCGIRGHLVQVIKILFICHGNICRSAAAEMVLKQMAREQGRYDLQIASAAATLRQILPWQINKILIT